MGKWTVSTGYFNVFQASCSGVSSFLSKVVVLIHQVLKHGDNHLLVDERPLLKMPREIPSVFVFPSSLAGRVPTSG